MSLLIDLSFSWANIIPSFLLIFCLGYWITVLIGVLDISSFDVEVEVDVDMDVDADIDGGGGQSGVGWLNHALVFFNLGKVPFMIWLTIHALATWFICVDVNYIIGNSTFILGLAIFLGAALASAFIAKFVTQPFLKFFISLQQDDLKVDLIGAIGIVKLPISEDSKGQVVVKKNKSTHIISAFIESNTVDIKKGEKVLVIAKDDLSNSYLVQIYND